MFLLHQQLDADTALIMSLDICRVLLMKDKRYPWVILVPEIDNLREIHDLDAEDFQKVMAEARHCSEALQKLFGAYKMNMAALGNMVPQLHVHIIARFETDPAWPGPIWGVGDLEPYTENELHERVSLLQETLSL